MMEPWIIGPSEMTTAALELLDIVDTSTAEGRAVAAVVKELCFPQPIPADAPSYEQMGIKIGHAFAAATLEVLSREMQRTPAEGA